MCLIWLFKLEAQHKVLTKTGNKNGKDSPCRHTYMHTYVFTHAHAHMNTHTQHTHTYTHAQAHTRLMNYLLGKKCWCVCFTFSFSVNGDMIPDLVGQTSEGGERMYFIFRYLEHTVCVPYILHTGSISVYRILYSSLREIRMPSRTYRKVHEHLKPILQYKQYSYYHYKFM